MLGTRAPQSYLLKCLVTALNSQHRQTYVCIMQTMMLASHPATVRRTLTNKRCEPGLQVQSALPLLIVTRRLTAWCVCSLRQSTFQVCVQRMRSTLRCVALSTQPASQLVGA